MNKETKRIGLTDILLIVLTAAFWIGSFTILKACDPMEDGTYMTCHWANRAITGAAALSLAIAVAHAILPQAGQKLGAAVALMVTALYAAAIPGIGIDLCMMDTMRCRAIMRPATIVFAVLIAAVALWDVLRHRGE